MNVSLAAAMALVACLATTPAGAEDKPDPKDAKTVQTCIAAKGARNMESCIGVVANRCIGPDEGAKKDREVMDCLDRERLVWDQMLNESFRIMRDGLDEDQVAKLRDMQRAWITMRDTTCRFLYDYF